MRDSFRKIRLGDFMTDLPKSKLPAGAADIQGKYPFFCSSAVVKATHTSLQNQPAVLMGTGGMATVHFGNSEYAYSTDTWGFRSNNKFLQTEFLYRIIQYNLHKIDYAGFEGSGLRHLRKDYVRDLRFDIPKDKNIRKLIIYILRNIDDSIEKTTALIHKFQQIKAGLMHDLFTRGVTADGKLRPTREQAPELYKVTPIGWIPKEWDYSDLEKKASSEYQHLRTGPFGSALKGEHWVEEGHPVITIGALGEGGFINSELLYIGDFDAKRLTVFRLKLGEIVFSRVADVGRSVVIKKDQVGWIMSSNLMRISLDRDQVIPEFLQYQLSYDSRVKNQIRCKINSGGREVANSDILNRLIFVWPKFEEQETIVQRANIVDARLLTEREMEKKLQKQKSGLMHDLLTGKVLVKINQITKKEPPHV